MRVLKNFVCGLFVFAAFGRMPQGMLYAHAATQKQVDNDVGQIEFRVGSSQTGVVAGARVIVINHDGRVIATGLTDSTGRWVTTVPFYEVVWNANFQMKGVVNAIVIANGYNEQVAFVVPITRHTIQPIVLQPVDPNGRNQPARALGDLHAQDLVKFIAHYAQTLGLKRQNPLPGDMNYAPWSPDKAAPGVTVK